MKNLTKVSFAIAAAAVGVWAAHSSAGAQVARSQLGSSIQVAYGTVESVEVGKLDPTAAAGKGATVGGMLGLAAASHDNDARGAVEGAAAGALISGLIAKHQKETAPNAYTYTIALVNGSEEKIVTETGDIRDGDCVSVEQGSTANVRRVADAFCDAGHQPAIDGVVQANAQEEAAECHASKQLAMQAKSEADMDMAMKKVRLFCDG